VNGERRNPVEAMAEEYAARLRRGERPEIAEYVERHPDRREEIEELFPAVALLEHAGTPGSRSPSPAHVTPAIDRLGDFRIVRELGRGGMGIVYEAEQVSLGRRVALKVLPAGALLTPGQVERFRREARAAAKLHHTNIVPVFGVGEQDGLHYYAMQLIPGRGLDEILAAGEAPWDPRDAARVARQAAEALDHAHSRGTLHRDIKPANLLLDESGTVWVGDFGLAKALTEEDGLTGTGDLVGTVRYMAPERFEGCCDGRSDLYGLGLTLYEALTGRPVFEGTDGLSLVRRVREETPPAPRKLVPEIPRDLETIVLKAIARDPAHRYATAGDLAEDLQRFLEDRPIRARRVGPIGRTTRWCRRNRALAAVGALAMVALVLAAAAGWLGYLATADALDREADRRAEAEVATGRAEANESLSLEAFEMVFEALPRPGDRTDSKGERERMESALLEGIVTFYDRFAEQNGSNPRLRLEVARAHRRVGTIDERRGRFEEAGAAFDRAVESLRALVTEFPDEADYRAELAETLAVSAARAREDLGAAERLGLEAIRLATDLVASHPAELRYGETLVSTHAGRASCLARLGRTDEALAAVCGAARVLEQQAARFEPRPLRPSEALGRASEAVANELRKLGRFEEARTLLEEALAAFRGSREHAKLRAKLHERLAGVLRRLGERDAALDADRRADELRREDRRRPGGGNRDRAGDPRRRGRRAGENPSSNDARRLGRGSGDQS